MTKNKAFIALALTSLVFNTTYEYAAVYESGLPRVITMNSNQLQLI